MRITFILSILTTDVTNEEEAKKWDEGGAYRVALHTVSGALAGGVGGAIGSATVASSAPILESFQNSTTQALIDAGMSSDSAATIASGLTSITATGMGALAGSTTGEAGTLNGAATAYTTDANNRQLHDQEKRWIKNHAKEYAQKTGLTPEQAETLLTKAAMYYVDHASSDALTQKQKDAGFLSLNPYDQSQYVQAYNYMRANSKGEYFTDVYNEDKITRQPLFTATKAQYANSSYNPNQSQGLVDESLAFLPVGKGASGASKTLTENAGNTNKWIDEAGNIKWPQNDGFIGTPNQTIIQPGALIDRYGYNGGTFASPKGTPYEARSLAPGTENKPYNVYEVIKPIEAFAGKSAPYFDQIGGGIQYKFDRSIGELLDKGYLKKVN